MFALHVQIRPSSSSIASSEPGPLSNPKFIQMPDFGPDDVLRPYVGCHSIGILDVRAALRLADYGVMRCSYDGISLASEKVTQTRHPCQI